jgi:hypothetical protein
MIPPPPTIDIDPTIEHEVELYPSSTYLHLPVDVIAVLPGLLRAAGYEEAALSVVEQRRETIVPEERRAYIEEAIKTYVDEGEVEVDGNAIVSSSDTGAYVMAWVWIDEEQI